MDYPLREYVIIENKHYEDTWSILKADNRGSSCSDIYICRLKNGTNKKAYLIKIINKNEYDFKEDSNTIKLQIKLSEKNIMPNVYDCGYIYMKDYELTRVNRVNRVNEKICYYVMDLYMVTGGAYIIHIISKVHDKIILDTLYEKYMKKVFTLYQQIALSGICSFDVKSSNVVVNYDAITFEITDLRLIDIDYEFTEITRNPSIQIADKYLTAMILMNFMIYLKYERLLYSETVQSITPIKYYYGLISDKFDFDSLIDLKSQSEIYNNITYIILFCCYYKEIKMDDILDYDKNKIIELFQQSLSEIIPVFPFQKNVVK